MNWINLLCQVFFGILVTGIAGSVMLTIWFLCRLLLQKWNFHLVYYMLRWVVVMFLLPVTFTAMMLNYEAGYVQLADGIPKMVFVIDINKVLFQRIAVVWFVATILICGVFLVNEIAQRHICKWNFEDGSSSVQEEFERIKEVLGVKGKVTLLRNDHPNLKSPFAKGIWNRIVVIPYLNYSEEELKVILYHELNHIRKSDAFFRYLTMFALMVNSINPFCYFLVGLVTEWSEADCDARAVEGLEKEGITKKRYYHVIMDLMLEDTKTRELFTFPMLLDKKKRIYRRMSFMEKYRMNQKKMAKPVAFMLTLMFALLSTVSAYAAGVEVAETSDEQFKVEQTLRDEQTFTENVGWSDEMTIPPSDAVNIVYINDGIMTLSGSTFDWNVPIGTRYVTSSIYMSKDTEVQIACTASPSDCTYWFGVMYPDNSSSIVEGSGAGSHTFKIPANGFYRILVENRSGQVIRAAGSYQY